MAKPTRPNAHNVTRWSLSDKNSARRAPGLREVDTLKPSSRPAAVKAAKDYVKSSKAAKVADKSKDSAGYIKAIQEGSRTGEFLRATGGTPTKVFKQVGGGKAEHGTWEGIYT